MMNRPKREDYKTRIEYDEYGEMHFGGGYDYAKALENYCDELEKSNEYCKDCKHCSKWWKDDYIYELEAKCKSLYETGKLLNKCLDIYIAAYEIACEELYMRIDNSKEDEKLAGYEFDNIKEWGLHAAKEKLING